jgi:hypothetical protein
MKPIELNVMKHFGRGYTDSFVIALNSHLIKGEFPHTATQITDLKIPMEKIADAFSVTDLAEMLNYRNKSYNAEMKDIANAFSIEELKAMLNEVVNDVLRDNR